MNQQTNTKMNRAMSLMNLMLAIALVASTVGCAAMNPGTPPVPAVQGHTHVATYKVIFGNADGAKPVVYKGALEGNMTVQQALAASGADRKHKNITVDIARRAESGDILKLPVLVDPKSGKVLPEQDYAIHPGDEILIRKAPNPGMFESMFKQKNMPAL